MTGKYILDPHGEPVACEELLTWARWFETADRTVAQTELASAKVSTVFLGLDHSFGSGPPLLYETLVFGGLLDGESDRYTTRAEALAGHARMVAKVATTP